MELYDNVYVTYTWLSYDSQFSRFEESLACTSTIRSHYRSNNKVDHLTRLAPRYENPEYLILLFLNQIKRKLLKMCISPIAIHGEGSRVVYYDIYCSCNL